MLGQYEHLYLGFRVLHSCNHLLRQLSDVLCLGILKDSQVAFNTLRTQKVSPLATSGPGGGRTRHMKVHTSNLALRDESCFSGAEALLCRPACTSLSSSWPILSILAAAASAICAPAASSDLAALCALRPALT